MVGTLTKREMEVVSLLAQGKTVVEIGEALGISRYTARAHITMAQARLGIGRRTALACWYVRHVERN